MHSRDWFEGKTGWAKRENKKNRRVGFYGVHQVTFDLLLSAGLGCNKLLVVKGPDTSWPSLQTYAKVVPVSWSGVADRPGYGPIASLPLRAHLEGSTLAENETLCLLRFSHDIFIIARSGHPYTSIIFLFSRSHREALMRNICGSPNRASAAVLLSSLKVHVSLSALARAMQTFRTDLQIVLFRSRTLFIPLLYLSMDKVKRASVAILYKEIVWPAAALAGRQNWLWELNRCEAESQSQARYINYHCSSIRLFCGSVNLPKALKAETRVMNSTVCEDGGGGGWVGMHTQQIKT